MKLIIGSLLLAQCVASEVTLRGATYYTRGMESPTNGVPAAPSINKGTPAAPSQGWRACQDDPNCSVMSGWQRHDFSSPIDHDAPSWGDDQWDDRSGCDDECDDLDVARNKCEANDACVAVYGYFKHECFNTCTAPLNGKFGIQGDQMHYDGTETVWEKPPPPPSTPPPPRTLPPPESADACDGQKRFDVRMCHSYACTKCTQAWCTEKCQEVQNDFPGCRCADWATARPSYSGGDFAGKGKFGDVGDYSK